ncbi:hypothetical protein R50073_21340 [Maricurvus nonylphenolicus]|uniref:hypothetical protein n=1 Tax=Maricurvus nonylphenolicus TaxID=1008307 RepID=UPI0036F40095
MYVYRYAEVKASRLNLEFIVAAKDRESAIKKLGIAYQDFYKHGMETKNNYCLDVALGNKGVIFYRKSGSDDVLKPLPKDVSTVDMCEKIADQIF